jgi:signal transduction histidine kinase/ligand-binding sensor domain-containing protein/CheY-like chemotaxis protein
VNNLPKICRSALFVVLALPALIRGQTTFINIGAERGLSSLQITDLFQDSYGFVWVGTPHGLNRFDGYGCVQYFNLPDDTTSLSSSYISPRAFVEDASGNLWVATFRGGLNYFNRKTERFTRYQKQKAPLNSISMDKLFAIEPDGKGGLWIATAGRGINHFDPETQSFRVWDADNKHPDLLMGSTMTGCLKNAGRLWIGTNKGACRFDPEKDGFEYFPFVPGLERSLSDGFVSAILEDSRGNIWLGTAHGLNRWDDAREIFVKYFFAHTFPGKEPGYDYILDILEDDDGRLWLGTNAGLLRFNPADGTYERFLHAPDDPFSIRKGPVSAILKDHDGNIWFGTNHGISILNKAGGKLSHERFLPVQEVFKTIAQTEGINAVLEVNDALWLATQTGIYRYPYGKTVQTVSSGIFSALFYDAEKREVYTGTIGDGFYVFDAEKLSEIRHIGKSKIGENADPFTVSGNRINSFVKDSQGYFWIAADGCLNRYDPEFSGRFRKFTSGKKNIQNPSSNTNQHLLSDSKGNLWIASMGGLSRLSKAELSKPFDDKTLHFEHFLHQPGNSNTISSDVVFCLLESTNGHIWAGTDAGLNRFDPQTGDWQWFFKADGLPGNEINVLVEDRNGDIWAGGAHEGLAKYDLDSGRFFHFSKNDGLNTDRFRPNAGLCSAEGFVVLGGRSGLVGFHPDSLLQQGIEPLPLYFTDFKIFNKTVSIGEGDKQLRVPVYQTAVIELDYDQNVISFQFTALNFVSPEKQVYRYRLVPFHRDWQYNGNNREATFTNLDPGVYQLQVETSENGYDWTGKSLTLRIRPPWYRTWWAILLYTLVTGSILYGVRRFELRRQLAKAEARRLQELDSVKTRLYTNITHEFRTPLTVILGEASQLEKQVGEKQKGGLAAIRRQGRQLLNLVNQMLDLAKVEAGSMHLNMVQGNVILFLRYLLESFHSLADSKQIELRFETDTEEFWMDYDPDKLQKIASNLLSNAIKFTPQGGRVTMKCTPERRSGQNILLARNGVPGYLQVTVSDSGQGIPPENLPFVFDRFYQADDSATRQAEGTGIGLTLTKELVHLLGGQISVESRPGEGATFTVTLPVTRMAAKKQFQPESFFTENQEIVLESDASVPNLHPEFSGPISNFNRNRPRLLVVEDNPDVVRYISSLLVSDYQIFKAQNGKLGVEAAFRLVPDLVISDVMMPEMDGFEVCRILKTDERTSHIPVILLTAKADQSSKIEGLTHGADVYLPKPFDQEELLIHLEKLIELRRRLQERYARFANFSSRPLAGDKSADSLDPEERFLQKVTHIVEARMGDEEFDMPQLCKALHMSRSNLFRKLKALTGKSATELIRYLRLEKARELLETTDLNVTEVCFRVGFSSPNYFSRAFQEAFGVAPSEVRKR